MFYIYMLTHKYSGEFYIGYSSNPVHRARNHTSRLTRGTHNKNFQKIWDKYRNISQIVVLEILDECTTEEEAKEVEQWYIDNLTPALNGQQVPNNIATGKKEPVSFLSPEGVVYENISNISKLARSLDISAVGLRSLRKGTVKQWKGWRLLSDPSIEK